MMKTNNNVDTKGKSAKSKKDKSRKRKKDDFSYELVSKNILSDETPFNIREAYKATRTNIMFALAGIDGCKTIILTSSIPGEGKTLTSINTAITFAQTGAKVILIDCDLRKSKLHKYLNTDNTLGLSNILGSFDKLEDCIRKSEHGFDYITSGHVPPNPMELLSSERMELALNHLSEKYDYIFLDTPPVNVVADTTAISKMSTGILFIVRHKYTTHDMVYKAVNSLEFVNSKILGFILNDVDLSTYSYTAKTKYGKYRYKNYYSYNSYYY